ncbi:hypothetical protein HHI36_009819 [Cryptolaemus montrouzieri]|uniref:Uncharacterized protein n=1 Tax=Cryptolaemus montrouzieri TaxID=559131 RepID=A0ABD2MH06_9CUCU
MAGKAWYYAFVKRLRTSIVFGSRRQLLQIEYQASRLINEAYERAAKIDNVVNRFEATGTWPINRNIFQDHHFAPAEALVASAGQNDSPNFSSPPSNMQYDVPHTTQVAKPTELDEFKSTLNIPSPLPRNNSPGKGRGAQKAVKLTSSPYRNDLDTSQQKDNQKITNANTTRVEPNKKLNDKTASNKKKIKIEDSEESTEEVIDVDDSEDEENNVGEITTIKKNQKWIGYNGCVAINGIKKLAPQSQIFMMIV